MSKMPMWEECLNILRTRSEWMTSDEVQSILGRGRIPTIETRIRELRFKHGHDVKSRPREGAGGQHEYKYFPPAEEQSSLFDNTQIQYGKENKA